MYSTLYLKISITVCEGLNTVKEKYNKSLYKIFLEVKNCEVKGSKVGFLHSQFDGF